MTISNRIIQARKSQGLTQMALAHKMGVSHSTVNRWEAGHRAPSRKTMAMLANVTSVSIEWLELGQTTGSGIVNSEQQPLTHSIVFKKEASMITNPAIDNPIIAYQGVPGAYSHLACKESFPQMEPLPCPSFEDAFAAVEEGRAGLAMIPIENSLGGRVADIHHLLPESNLFIIAEHFQPVHHNILAPKGASLEGLKEVRSHTQALAQCRDTLRELGIKPVKDADTAGAAKLIGDLNDPTVGAIASNLAGEIYGLDSLRSRVEDKIGNVTRFIVMSRTRIEPDPRSGPSITSLVFSLRSMPAALYKAMGGFATNGVNFIKLESYISVGDYNTARFYAEIEGHPAEKSVDMALEELQYFTTKVKILGTYSLNEFRNKE